MKPGQKHLAPKNSCIIQEIEGQRYIKFVDEPEEVIAPIRFTRVTICYPAPDTILIPPTEPFFREPEDRVKREKKKKGRKGICNPGVCIPLPKDPPPTDPPPPTVYDPPVGCNCCLNPPPDEEDVDPFGYAGKAIVSFCGHWGGQILNNYGSDFNSCIGYTSHTGEGYHFIVNDQVSNITSEMYRTEGKVLLATISVYDYDQSEMSETIPNNSKRVFASTQNSDDSPGGVATEALIHAALQGDKPYVIDNWEVTS